MEKKIAIIGSGGIESAIMNEDKNKSPFVIVNVENNLDSAKLAFEIAKMKEEHPDLIVLNSNDDIQEILKNREVGLMNRPDETIIFQNPYSKYQTLAAEQPTKEELELQKIKNEITEYCRKNNSNINIEYRLVIEKKSKLSKRCRDFLSNMLG